MVSSGAWLGLAFAWLLTSAVLVARENRRRARAELPRHSTAVPVAVARVVTYAAMASIAIPVIAGFPAEAIAFWFLAIGPVTCACGISIFIVTVGVWRWRDRCDGPAGVSRGEPE